MRSELGRHGWRAAAGVTLIELVVAIVALSLVLVMMTTLIFPQAGRSVDPIQQSRAAELGQSLLDEILSRSFDHCSGHDGLTFAANCGNNPRGSFRCDEQVNGQVVSCIAAIPDCPGSGWSSATEEVSGGVGLRALFNDVDDYHCLDQADSAITDALGQSLGDHYRGFRLQVSVSYAGADLGLANRLAKRVAVTVTAPSGDLLQFAGYKGNY